MVLLESSVKAERHKEQRNPLRQEENGVNEKDVKHRANSKGTKEEEGCSRARERKRVELGRGRNSWVDIGGCRSDTNGERRGDTCITSTSARSAVRRAAAATAVAVNASRRGGSRYPCTDRSARAQRTRHAVALPLDANLAVRSRDLGSAQAGGKSVAGRGSQAGDRPRTSLAHEEGVASYRAPRLRRRYSTTVVVSARLALATPRVERGRKRGGKLALIEAGDSSHAHPGGSCKRSTAVKEKETKREKEEERDKGEGARRGEREIEAGQRAAKTERRGEAIARGWRVNKREYIRYRDDRARRGKHGWTRCGMAWGYWSATTVSDRGRSPRREKDKQHQSLHQHQPPSQQQQQQQAQQQMHQTELSAQSTYASVQERELSVTGPGIGIVTEEPPCSMMIQGGSFYSYSAATAAAAAAAVSRRISTVVEGSGGGGGPSSITSTGIQVLPRERHVKPGTSTHPPSPGSGDSAEYEQPLIGQLRSADISPPPILIGSPPHHHQYYHHLHHDDIFAQPGTSSRATKLVQCPPDAVEGMDELSEAELEEVAANAELIYGIGPTATCRVHGPCSQQPLPLSLPPESALSMTSLLDVEPAGPSPFQFNEITWGRCNRGEDTRLRRKSTSLARDQLCPPPPPPPPSLPSRFFDAARDLGQSLPACLPLAKIILGHSVLVRVRLRPVHLARCAGRDAQKNACLPAAAPHDSRISRPPSFRPALAFVDGNRRARERDV
ncbi:hypothetical protein DBV15_05380 [Temnothorax longispinosus]|uniref:Uncharacterized protein n=1 Tax=Temnothorax longispinosus TaxID=300112 RepID=A0A4S2JDX9_9HYME|nr:hypothetical protein DBV15_05380 [Temnothorax longispinosus]